MRLSIIAWALFAACSLQLLSQSLPSTYARTKWTGSATVPGAGPWKVVITFGSRDAEVEYPTLKCNGTLALVSTAQDGTLQFQFTLAAGPCVNNTVVRLIPSASGALDYEEIAHGSPTAKGTLTREIRQFQGSPLPTLPQKENTGESAKCDLKIPPRITAEDTVSLGESAQRNADYEQAGCWFYLGSKAGSARAEGDLAGMFFLGQFLKKDNVTALRLATDAASKGDKLSASLAADIYEDDGDKQRQAYWEAVASGKITPQPRAPARDLKSPSVDISGIWQYQVGANIERYVVTVNGNEMRALMLPPGSLEPTFLVFQGSIDGSSLKIKMEARNGGWLTAEGEIKNAQQIQIGTKIVLRKIADSVAELKTREQAIAKNNEGAFEMVKALAVILAIGAITSDNTSADDNETQRRERDGQRLMWRRDYEQRCAGGDSYSCYQISQPTPLKEADSQE